MRNFCSLPFQKKLFSSLPCDKSILLLAHELSDWIGKEIHGKGLEAASKNWNFFLGVFLSSFSLSPFVCRRHADGEKGKHKK
jgi:hypothetical protein